MKEKIEVDDFVGESKFSDGKIYTKDNDKIHVYDVNAGKYNKTIQLPSKV